MNRARTVDQFRVMKAAEETGSCIFCEIFKKEKKWILEGKYWSIKKNDYPYTNHDHHLVIIFREHTEEITGVTPEAWQELGKMVLKIYNKLWTEGLNLVIRFGDPDLRSSTIHHLHCHIQVPSSEIIRSHCEVNPGEVVKITESPHRYISWLETAKELWPTESIARWLIYCYQNPDPFQFQKLLIIKPRFYAALHEKVRFNKVGSGEFKSVFFEDDFEGLMGAVQRAITGGRIAGGGVVVRFGYPSFTGSEFGFIPHAKIYCPNGKGRVQATFVKPLFDEKKAPCKATFCKGFDGNELEILKKRMREFQSL